MIAALYKPTNEKVAIKRIDLEKCGADIDEMRVSLHALSLINLFISPKDFDDFELYSIIQSVYYFNHFQPLNLYFGKFRDQ